MKNLTLSKQASASAGGEKRKLRRGLAIVALSALTVLVAGALSMTTASAAAAKGDLLAQSGRSSCAIPAAGGVVHGFGVVNETESSERIVVEVSIKDGAPNLSYDVHLVQCEGASDAPVESLIGTLMTNIHGNGNFHGSPLELEAGVDQVFVGLFGGPDQIYATGLLPA
jgi:hypothetical protein